MIEIVEISKKATDYNSYEEFYEKYKTAIAESYEQYIEHGHTWCWSLVGNIVKEHEYGEEREIKYGTKHFSGGTKVFIAPAQWGDGYEKIVVIGLPRYGHRYIEIITQSKYIENYRIKKVYKPAILKRMCLSRYLWWGDTENDKKRIIKYLEFVSLDIKDSYYQKNLEGKMFQDKSGIFEDFGFKLVVINALLDKETSFSKELEKMKEMYVDTYDGDGFACIPEMAAYFENLMLTEKDLEQVTELSFDGGEDIYFLLMTDWDGESDEFDVKSVKGFEKLPNLEKVDYIAMCDKKLMDEFTEAGITVS